MQKAWLDLPDDFYSLCDLYGMNRFLSEAWSNGLVVVGKSSLCEVVRAVWAVAGGDTAVMVWTARLGVSMDVVSVKTGVCGRVVGVDSESGLLWTQFAGSLVGRVGMRPDQLEVRCVGCE